LDEILFSNVPRKTSRSNSKSIEKKPISNYLFDQS
jgi:hypothetical protein